MDEQIMALMDRQGNVARFLTKDDLRKAMETMNTYPKEYAVNQPMINEMQRARDDAETRERYARQMAAEQAAYLQMQQSAQMMQQYNMQLPKYFQFTPPPMPPPPTYTTTTLTPEGVQAQMEALARLLDNDEALTEIFLTIAAERDLPLYRPRTKARDEEIICKRFVVEDDL